MLRVITVLASPLFVTGAYPASVAAQQLVGTWVGTEVRPGVLVSGKTVYSPDGTFHVSALIRRDTDVPQLVLVGGTWRIEGNYLVTTTTTSNAETLMPLGEVLREQLVSATRTRLASRSDSGQLVVRYRQ